MRALDGLRGLAISAVVAYHISPAHVPYGTVGVTIFFVLSGYLITALMLREQERNGRFDYLAFYARRALRLYPALIAAVMVTWAVMFVTHDPQASSTYPIEAVLALLYLSDIAQPAGVSMPTLGHTWSLAVEEQFYLVWPALLIGVLFVFARADRSRLRWAVLAIACAALIWRLIITLTSADWVRIYFAPDSNAFPLLAGCVLALFGSTVAKSRWFGWASLVALVALCVVPHSDHSLAGWRLTMIVGSAAALLAVVLVHNASVLGPVLENRPMVLLGTISYGWYLWHQIVWGIHPFGTAFGGPFWHVVAAAVALVLAAFSYRFLERPLQRRLRRFVQPRAGITGGSGHRDVGTVTRPPISR